MNKDQQVNVRECLSSYLKVSIIKITVQKKYDRFKEISTNMTMLIALNLPLRFEESQSRLGQLVNSRRNFDVNKDESGMNSIKSVFLCETVNSKRPRI